MLLSSGTSVRAEKVDGMLWNGESNTDCWFKNSKWRWTP